MEGSSRRILVCLISRQTMQNLLPILQYRPQQVVCITTTQEDESRHRLEGVLRAHHIPSDPPLYVDAYRPDSTLAACRQIIAHYGPELLTANITGGTKVMSIAAFRAFSTDGIPCTYTDTLNRSLLPFYPMTAVPRRYRRKSMVLTYLQARGWFASLGARNTRLSVPELAAFIGQHIARLDPFFGAVTVRGAGRPRSFQHPFFRRGATSATPLPENWCCGRRVRGW